MTQDPNWQRPQQPYQYLPQYQPPQYGPPPRRKGGAGKRIALGCLGMVLIIVLVLVVAILLANGQHPATGA